MYVMLEYYNFNLLFPDFQMDVCAILNADDELLKDMGLIKAGDRLSLRGFCSSCSQSEKKEENQTKKRKLLEAFLDKKKGKKTVPTRKAPGQSHPSQTVRGEKVKTKKVQLGWKHFKEEEGAYVLVPLLKGGGSRQVELPLSTNKWDLMKTCKALFFPDGKSIFGKEEEMAFDLANFKNEKIEITIKVEGNELPFNINNYIDAYKVKNVRIYLRSQKICDYSSDEGDKEDLLPMIDINSVDNGTALIGSSKERQALVSKQDKEFQESLSADRQKLIDLESEATEDERKVKIQQVRGARVIPEPDANFVTVKVRHLIMGICSRRFPADAKMSAVYDWAGSLSPDTENFTLCDPFGVILLPNSELSDRCTISMVKASQTPSMSDSDDEIQFQGFGDTSTSSTATEPDLETNTETDGKRRNEGETSQ